jgi:MFS family permease
LFNTTGSSIATSLLWVTYALPAIIIGPFSAVLVDIFDRKKTLMITNLLQSLVIFLFALFHQPHFFLLYGAVIIYSLLNQFYVPAELASLPSLVKKVNLSFANSLFFLTQQFAIVLGFGSAGILINILGFSNTLFLSSVLLFLAFVSVSFLPSISFDNHFPKSFDKLLVKFFKDIFEGYKFIKSKRDILLPFSMLIIFQTGLYVVMVNVPAIARDIFHINVELSGISIVAPAGIGAAMGALIVPSMLKREIRKKKIIETSMLIMIISFYFATFFLSFLPSFLRLYAGILLVIILGFSYVGMLIPSQTYLQEVTPTDFRGRVFGNYWFVVTVVTVLPVIFSGAITDILGVRSLFFVIASVILSMFITSKKRGGNLLIKNSR